jgi:hypothetical protein
MMVGEPGPTRLGSQCFPLEVATMPVFLALALISGQPLNLVPDDCPQLPPWRICQEREEAAAAVCQKWCAEWKYRESYKPTPETSDMWAKWLQDPKALERWREDAMKAFEDASAEGFFWTAAQFARQSVGFDERASLIAGCRQYLGEARWQKVGWWK